MGDIKKDFYVYEWFNTETNEVFYVGKGRGYRYKNTVQRNNYFINYYKKYKCDVRKVRNKLEENVAFQCEIELIKKYRDIGQCKCNLSDGGEGSTYPKGSYNEVFRKLQYHHDCKRSMDDMVNEEEYDPINLKTKSLEELETLYEEYLDYREGVQTYNYLEMDKNELTGFELKTQNQEIVMLTELIANNVAKNNEEFNDFLNWKEEYDFICIDFDSDKFLGLMFSNIDYYIELRNITLNILSFMKTIGNNPKLSVLIKIKSYYIKGGFIHIKFNTSDEKTIRRVKVNLYDIVWGILMFKNMALFQIIFQEIFSSPFISL